MFEVNIDVSPFEEKVRQMGAAMDQLPFALSRALNDAADETYNALIETTWTQAVKVRNPNFLRWALRTKFSTKYDLTVAIYDNTPDQRGHLALHAEGGLKVGRGRIAVPTGNVTKTGSGVARDQRPSALSRKVVKGNLIFQATGRGKRQKLKLMYVLAKQARQPKDVPFWDDFSKDMTDSAKRHFSQRVMEAMRTRR